MSTGDTPERHPFWARPHRTFLGLALPILVSLVAEPLTGLVDTFFVARLGAPELAALGIGVTLLSSVFWVFNFLGIGTQTEVGAAFGEGERERAGRSVTLALGLALALGTALAVGLWGLAGEGARLLGADPRTAPDAVSYVRLRALGGPAVLLTMVCFGALRGLQDMRTPLWIALGANALNAALDPVLIFGPGPLPALGTAGAAAASTLAQWLAAGVAIRQVARALPLSRRVPWRESGRLLVVGRDMVVRTGALLFFLALTTRQANRIGADAGAAHQAARTMWTFTAFLLDAYASAAQSLVAYFLAAGHRDGALRVAALGARWGLATGAVLLAAMLLGEGVVAALLVPESARGAFAEAWRWAALFQPVNALSFVTDGIHWGTGEYGFLRTGMVAASLCGMAGLWWSARADAGLGGVWLATGLWITVRAGFGVARVWPGFGAAPLRGAA